jgi:hypothetical protein
MSVTTATHRPTVIPGVTGRERPAKPRFRSQGSAPSPRRMQTPPVAWTDGAHFCQRTQAHHHSGQLSCEVVDMTAPGTGSASILQMASRVMCAAVFASASPRSADQRWIRASDDHTAARKNKAIRARDAQILPTTPVPAEPVTEPGRPDRAGTPWPVGDQLTERRWPSDRTGYSPRFHTSSPAATSSARSASSAGRRGSPRSQRAAARASRMQLHCNRGHSKATGRLRHPA